MRNVMKKASLPLIALLAVAAPLAMAQPHKASPPKSPRLYVFDCGTINATDASGYRLQKEEIATPKMSMECFLIAHPKGNLMWDVGAIPDSSFPPGGGVGTLRNAVASKTLTSQLAEAGYAPADINYLALSHFHWDHVGNANLFAGATCCGRDLAHAQGRTRRYVRCTAFSSHRTGQLQRVEEQQDRVPYER
jgi:N-acyl homoserine lactone hydrolase